MIVYAKPSSVHEWMYDSINCQTKCMHECVRILIFIYGNLISYLAISLIDENTIDYTKPIIVYKTRRVLQLLTLAIAK